MTKKILRRKKEVLAILVCLSFILLSCSAFAVVDDASVYYSFDNDTVTGVNIEDISGTGASQFNGTKRALGEPVQDVGKLNAGVTFDGSDDNVSVALNAFTTANIVNGLSFSFWAKNGVQITNNDDFFGIIDWGHPNEALQFLHREADGGLQLYVSDLTGNVRSTNLFSPPSHNDTNFHHYVWTMNATREFELYFDGSKQALSYSSNASPATFNAFNAGDNFMLGSAHDVDAGTSIGHWAGTMDEWTAYGKILNSSDVAALYKGGAGFNPYEPLDELNLSAAYPQNDTQYNTATINLNISVNATATFNCTLYLNGTVNDTRNNTGPGTAVVVNFTKTFVDSAHTVLFACRTSNTTENSTTNTFYIDTTNPTITTNFVNNTLTMENNLTGQFNFSDNEQLHSYNISIDGTQVDGAAGLTSPFHSYNLSQDTSSYSAGNHTLTVRVADGHTAQTLKDPEAYNPSNGLFNDYLKYEFEAPYEETYVEIKGLPSSLFDTFTTSFNGQDRYKMLYEPNDLKSSYTFEVESDNEIYIYNSSEGKYGGQWLIVSEHWLDFYVEDAPNLDVKIDRINANKVLVNVSGLNASQSVIEFNSIGDLNIVTKNYNFFNGNNSVIFTNPVFEGSVQSMVLRLNTTGGVTTAADLYWNGTLFEPNLTTYADYDEYNVTFNTKIINSTQETTLFYWTYNLTLGAVTERGNLSDRQNISQRFNMSVTLDSNDTLESQVFNASIIINKDPNTSVSNVNASYNGSVFTAVLESSSTFQENWSVAINAEYPLTVRNLINSITYNATLTTLNGTSYPTNTTTFTVYQMVIDDCTYANLTMINFSFKDEETLLPLNVDTEILFKYWNRTESLHRNYSTNTTSTTYTQYCIYPNFAIMTGDILLEYSRTGYDTRQYIAQDATFDTTVDWITLFLLNTTQAVTVTVHVTDQNDDAIAGVLVEIYKYDIGNNEFNLTETGLTNFNGEITVNLLAGNNYRFDLYQDGTLEVSEILEILSTTADLYFRIIGSIITTLENYIDLTSIISSDLTYNSVTELVEFTWSGASGVANQMCLRVDKLNLTDGQTTQGTNCTSTVTDTSLSLVLSNETAYFFAVGRARSSVDNLYYTIQELEIDNRVRSDTFEEEGILLTWVLTGTVTFLGMIVNPAIGIVLCLFTLFVCSLMGLIHLSVGTLISITIIGGIVIYYLKT